MKVLFLPASMNPYQRELAASLSKLGVVTEIGSPRRYLPVLRVVAEIGKPDIFHLHWIDPLALGRNSFWTALKGLRLILELITLRLMGVRIVWTVHNLTDHDNRAPRLQMLINRAVGLLSNRLIVHSRSARRVVHKSLWLRDERFSIVPHASFAETYENDVSQQEARDRLGLPRESLVFLHFGLLREYKGTRELLRSFSELNLPEARLLVAGSPKDPTLEQAIQAASEKDPRVLAHLEHVPEAEVQLYVNASDVFVLPYRESLTSGVALLAMGFGRPVIAPRTAVMEEVLDSTANIFFDAQEGHHLLSTAMKEASSCDLRAMGQRNLALAKQLSWQQMAFETMGVYLRALGPKSAKTAGS